MPSPLVPPSVPLAVLAPAGLAALPEREPARTARAVRIALTAWTTRQWVAAGLFAVAFALLIGYPTVLIPNSVFGREIPVVAWNYPVWIATSLLSGLLAATYVKARRAPAKAVAAGDGALGEGASDEGADAPSRLGMAGGVLAWFAVGCPVCNKIALVVLGYSGALTWFAPVQPYLAGVALLLTAGAVVFRLRGQVFCPAPGGRRA